MHGNIVMLDSVQHLQATLKRVQGDVASVSRQPGEQA